MSGDGNPIAIGIALLALGISIFMAWRSWSSRRDYAKSVLIAKRIEVAADFLHALDDLQDGLVTAISAIKVVENSGAGPQFAQEKVRDLTDRFDRVDIASSKVAILFEKEVVDVARAICVELTQLCKLALEAAQGPNPQRKAFQERGPDLTAIKAQWIATTRPRIASGLDVFFFA